jgi:hypothetical protein
MTVPRKKPGVAFWATVVLISLLVIYPLSFGPACWIAGRVPNARAAVCAAYSPMTAVWAGTVSPGPHDSDFWNSAFRWYVNCGRHGSHVEVAISVTARPTPLLLFFDWR